MHLQAAQADLQEHASFEELAGAHRAKIAALQKQVMAAQQEAGAASDEAAALRGRLRQAQAGLSALEEQHGAAVQAEAQGEETMLLQGWAAQLARGLWGVAVCVDPACGGACAPLVWQLWLAASHHAAVAGDHLGEHHATPRPLSAWQPWSHCLGAAAALVSCLCIASSQLLWPPHQMSS